MAQLPDGTSVEADTLVALLRRWTGVDPDADLFSFLPDGDATGEVSLTRGELDRRARDLAVRLASRGLAGERALLLYPAGLEFIVAFFGCLYARVVAVPAYPPRPNRPMTRLTSIVEDARPAVVLTCDSLRKDASRWSTGIPGLDGVEVIFSDEPGRDGNGALGEAWADPGVTPETLAFLQYTSGSTASPKGVMITHGNLMANSARIQAVFGSVPGEHGVFWLPLFHDMGLIGGVIQTLYCGGASTLFPPVSFLQRPLRWLQAISRTGAIISGAPNFAYDLCVEKSTPEQRAELDLSRWKVAFNGAEPVRAETLDRFAEAFAPAGFRPEAFLPCYGLAEATLLVSGNPTGRRPRVFAADAGALGRGEVAEGDGPRLVSSGRPAEGHVVAIVDPVDGCPCPEGRVGEIWVAGPSVARGYWGRTDESGWSMDARLAGHEGRSFLRTGDLGFLNDGELFVTGRIKDMIILRGRNIYPQDVEWAAEQSHPALRAGGAGAFALEVDGEERLAIVVETERRLTKGAGDEIMAAIRGAVARALDVDVYAIRLLKPTSLPRTSSGKVQRHACREGFLDGTLEVSAEWTRQDREVVATPAPVAEPAPAAHVPGRSRPEIAAWLAAKVAGPLGLRPDQVDVRAPLSGFGIGSMQAVRLAADLEEWLGRKLAPTLIYDYPTILALAGHLAGESREAAPQRPSWTGGREPIAIVGIGCRFPGASSPSAFWDLLSRGVEAIGEVPDARWTEDDLRGLDFPRRSGFLGGIDLFDANFFGITRREAMFLDPQHRMLLEVAWEALEDAGQSPDRLAGAPVGVFIGISTNDYAFIQVKRGGAAIGHRVTGNSGSIAANRISHFFDFRGPSLAIDTACSSSLVATLTACRSIWEGESEIALAGGSNILLQTQVFAGFAKSGFLSPDGHCRAFDADANGYVRGEGAGVIVLKPLSRALGDGDAIYALIRGGAVNQDGRTNGLTAPSRPAQEAVLRTAYRHAGVAPGQIDYVEAHGTGTPLGDPIELAALGAVLSEGRDQGRRCILGSVKTNIGHLEAAAGAAGLIKASLALHHRSIPASLNYSRPNPHADLDALPLDIARTLNPWPDSEGPARAGVSAFGFGGTNAHLVLEEAPRIAIEERPDPMGEDVVIPLSARTPEALTELCRAFRDFLAADRADLRDVAYSAGARRAHLEHRLALVVAGRDEALDALDAFLRGAPHVDAVAGCRSPGLRNGPVFYFGDGSGLPQAAARALFRCEPSFRAAIERSDVALRSALNWSIVEALEGEDPTAALNSPRQAFTFAVQLALASLWESWGIAAGAFIGEGDGAIAAACASGMLGIEDGARALASPFEALSARDELARLAAQTYGTIIEIGAGPGARAMMREAFEGTVQSPAVLASLRPGDRGLESLRWSAAFLYADGFEIEWSRVLAGGQFVRMPNYPWQRERFWLDQEAPPPRRFRRREATAQATNGQANGHPAPAEAAISAPVPVVEPPPAADAGQRPGLLDYLRDRSAFLLGLPADQVAPDRPLVAMGLDSIAAMELKLDIDEFVGAKVPFSVLSEGTSIRDVAGKVLCHLDTIAATTDVSTPRSKPTPAAVQLSHGQRMLWYAYQFAPEGAAYHIAGAGVLRARLDLEAVRRALRRVIDRHDALRSTFPSVDGAPSLRLLETDDLVSREEEWLIIEDAAGLDPAMIPSRLTERFRRPFDIERGPLFRCHMLRRSDAEHVVLPVFHHIISDFLSAAVFLDDLGRAYLEEVAGKPTVWAPAPSFYDFARQQEEMLAGEEGARLWEYWRRRLDGPLPLLDLPTDHPRPIVRGDRGQTYRDALGPELSAALAAMGEERGASLFTVLLSAFQVLLARWAGQDEVIVGSPVAQRTRAGLEGTVGYLVNMLPMRAGLADDPSFEEFLARARRTVGEGLEHLEFPFSRMVERLGVAPDPGRAPIFQVMYAHQRTQRLDEQGLAPFALGVPGARLDLHGLAIDSTTLDRKTALFELALMTARDGDRLRLAWEYSTELFAEKTIATMSAGLQALLKAIVADPGCRLSELPVLSDDDRHRALEWWAAGPAATRSEGGIHHRFEREAAAAPDATALVFDGGSLTYAELNRYANVLACELIGRGIGPESVVGLFLDDWPLRLVGILGVLKAAAAYLPLDPTHPDPRLSSAFEDSRAAMLVTEARFRDRVASLSEGPALDLDALLEASDRDDPGNPGVPVDAGNLAYVIYTSGTTGRPKGVMVHHGALMATGSAWERLYDLRGSVRRHLQAAPFAFDVFTGDWVRALTTGGTLVSCPREVVLDPRALAERIRRHDIDAIELVPALAEALVEHLEDEPGGGPLPLRLLAMGSDTLRSGLIRRLERPLPTGARVVNSYGLTEAAVDSLCFDPVAEGLELPEEDATAPIGRPMAGVRAYVLDRRLEPVPPGVVGELYIGGEGVARGYVGDPSRTAARFLPDPHGAPGARMYATGDRARWSDGGLVELLGRVDDQLKIRGVRVEPAEVEAVLAGHASVRRAAVAVLQGARDEPRLAAYYVAGASIEPAELRRWLEGRLPEAMIPSWIIPMESLPLSPNGKVDRAALPAPGEEGAASKAYAPPRTAVEEQLAAIAAELLGRERVGIHDNFFDLGLDSIVGIRMIARARQAGLAVDPSQLFRSPTIAGLASSTDRTGVVAPTIAIEPFSTMPEGLDRDALARRVAADSGIEDAYPLTPVQAGMLFHVLADPEAGHYVEQFSCDLRGDLDLPALRAAWHRSIARHASLRCSIHWGDAETPYQVIHCRAEPLVEYHDWRGLPADEHEARLVEFIAADHRKGFDPARPPLSRLALIRLDQDRHRLIWSVHHVAVDGWCLALLLREALDTYEALRRGEEPELPPSRPYREYVAWLRGRDESEAQAYWRRALSGFDEPTPLGIEHRDDGGRVDLASDFDERELALDPEESQALLELCRSRRITPGTLIQGAWALLLSRYSGRSDVLFGVTVAGRPPELPGSEAMIGLFINTMPLRVAVPEATGLFAWLLQLQEQLAEQRRFEAVPLARIRAWSPIPPGIPMFESLVTVQNLPFVEALRDRAGRLGVEAPRFFERTHYPISLTALTDDRLRLRIGFDARRYDADPIERILGHLHGLLKAMAAGPDRRLGDLPWIPDRESLPGRGGFPPAGDPLDLSIPDLERLDEAELDAMIERLGRE